MLNTSTGSSSIYTEIVTERHNQVDETDLETTLTPDPWGPIALELPIPSESGHNIWELQSIAP